MICYQQGGIILSHGHVIDELRALPAGSVQTCVTSPPYFGLRSYGIEDQIWGDGWCGSLGNEPTLELFITHLVDVFREVKRVLRNDGTLWLNLGDSFINKNLLMIPARCALALQADGWYLRSDIIWAKGLSGDSTGGNVMPESVEDRCTKSHEYIFMLSKQAKYYYDNVAVAETSITNDPRCPYTSAGAWEIDGRPQEQQHGGERRNGYDFSTRNRRSVWHINTNSCDMELCTECKATYSGTQHKRLALHVDEGGGEHRICRCGRWDCWLSHFATYPERLVEPCILAATSARGACARCGTPWRRVVERRLVESDDSRPDRGVPGRTGKGHNKQRAGDPESTTTGWTPTCTCGAPEGMRPDDLEIIDSPTGERGETDPTLFTGRKGLNRPRGENEGQRPITRYEQRRYAEQLRNSPHRDTLEIEAGPAFAHYIRTDKAGARPIPEELLEGWIAKGLVAPVDVPTWEPPPVVPCVILDPFVGSGTTMVVAQKLARHGVGVDLNADYLRLAVARLPRQQAMVLEI